MWCGGSVTVCTVRPSIGDPGRLGGSRTAREGCQVLVTGFPAEAFGTNCYVVAPGPGEQCLIVDPGVGVIDQLDQVLAEHRLSPAAVLLTHGLFAHPFSVAPVCGARGITAYVPPAARELLADPVMG